MTSPPAQAISVRYGAPSGSPCSQAPASIATTVTRIDNRPDMPAGSMPTITITRLGGRFGIISKPVINRPEVSIVGVNRLVVDVHDAVESIRSVWWLIQNTLLLLGP
jgi:hypothetical protein